MGNTSFYGPGMIIDTTKPITVVTQFITADGTATDALTAIKRFYVQNGNVIPNSVSNIAGVPAQNYVSDSWCTAQKTAFGDINSFSAKGGLTAMGQSMDRGQVLVLSIWDDHAVDRLWLDSTYPTTSTKPGAARGTCPITSGQPTDVETNSPNPSVTFSNLKIGPLGSTFSSSTGSGGGTPSSSSSVAGSKTTSTSQAASVLRRAVVAIVDRLSIGDSVVVLVGRGLLSAFLYILARSATRGTLSACKVLSRPAGCFSML
jgi:cellulose 1,4-beta-cellobiosidase